MNIKYYGAALGLVGLVGIAGCSTSGDAAMSPPTPQSTVTVKETVPATPRPAVTVTEAAPAVTVTAPAPEPEVDAFSSDESTLTLMQLAWDEVPYSAQQTMCDTYNVSPSLLWSMWQEQAVGIANDVTRAQFDTFFSGVC